MKSLCAAAFAACVVAIATTSPVSADQLLIEGIRKAPPNAESGLPRPERGMTMAEVRERFGAPGERVGPVGNPPITRWIYDDFTVYFEDKYVLHSVIRREGG